MADALLEDVGGDVEAVEDIADVVEDAGGDLGHAGLAGGEHQILLGFGESGVGALLFLDLLHEFAGARRHAHLQFVVRPLKGGLGLMKLKILAGDQDAPHDGDQEHDETRVRMAHIRVGVHQRAAGAA